MYKDYFKCISIKDTLWYYYDDNRRCWIEDDKGIRLRKKISTEVWKKFNDLRIQLQNKIKENSESESSEQDSENKISRETEKKSRTKNRTKKTCS